MKNYTYIAVLKEGLKVDDLLKERLLSKGLSIIKEYHFLNMLKLETVSPIEEKPDEFESFELDQDINLSDDKTLGIKI